MMRLLLARLRRKHHALWCSLVYMEPVASPTWCVWVHVGGFEGDRELARSRSKWIAVMSALAVPAPW